MGNSPSFSSPITIPVTAPGSIVTGTTQCGNLSAPANVSASITADTSGGALTVASITSYVIETIIETPEPGEGGKVAKPIKEQVAVQVAQCPGDQQLAVATGQYVEVTVQFAPTSTTPENPSATLLITGDSWGSTPVAVPIQAAVGGITVKIKPLFVLQGDSAKLDVTVKLIAGAKTTANLIVSADGSADAPNVGISPHKKSVSLTKGSSVTASFTVSADTVLAAGQYSWNLAVWSYDDTASFSVPFTITVGVPYFFIKNKLNGDVIDIVGASKDKGAGLDAFPKKSASNDNQQWNFVPGNSDCFFIVSKLNGMVIDIKKDSSKDGASLGMSPKNDFADSQLWFFVQDPEGSSFSFIVNKSTGHVIDVQHSSKTAGTPLDAYPAKFTGHNNQLWAVEKGVFPFVVPTVQATKGVLRQGNANYFFGSQSEAIYGLSVTTKFTSDFVSSANGYSFQLNCLSSIGPTVFDKVQQIVVYATPGSTQLVARIENWISTSTELLLIESNLANLPSPTIPANYSLNITLSYYGDSALIAGATYTLTDGHGNVVGTTTIGILGASLDSGNPATIPDLAPVVAFQFAIGGDYNGTFATLTSAAGTVTYDASVGLIAQSGIPPYVGLAASTVESANLIWGWLPWPWSPSMDNDSESVKQTFEANTASTSPIEPLPALRRLRAMSPPKIALRANLASGGR